MKADFMLWSAQRPSIKWWHPENIYSGKTLLRSKSKQQTLGRQPQRPQRTQRRKTLQYRSLCSLWPLWLSSQSLLFRFSSTPFPDATGRSISRPSWSSSEFDLV